MSTYDSSTFSQINCSMQLGAPERLLAYVSSIEAFDEAAVTDILLRLHRCRTSCETPVLQHVIKNYRGSARISDVLMSAAMKRASEQFN